jgi:hypothetical protein
MFEPRSAASLALWRDNPVAGLLFCRIDQRAPAATLSAARATVSTYHNRKAKAELGFDVLRFTLLDSDTDNFKLHLIATTFGIAFFRREKVPVYVENPKALMKVEDDVVGFPCTRPDDQSVNLIHPAMANCRFDEVPAETLPLALGANREAHEFRASTVFDKMRQADDGRAVVCG